MSKPLVVLIPHQLGKDEAVRRLKSGFSGMRSNFGQVMTVQDETWSGDQLAFRVGVLGQTATGTIDVAETQVRLEVQLPWLLGRLAEKAAALIQKNTTLLLEKK